MTGLYLKCDADGCTHREGSEAYTQEMVGKPCPVCGESLLTQSDFDGWMINVQPILDLMIAEKMVSMGDDPDTAAMSVGLHDGKTSIEIKDATRAARKGADA